jgi:hypothetical protein
MKSIKMVEITIKQKVNLKVIRHQVQIIPLLDCQLVHSGIPDLVGFLV